MIRTAMGALLRPPMMRMTAPGRSRVPDAVTFCRTAPTPSSSSFSVSRRFLPDSSVGASRGLTNSFSTLAISGRWTDRSPLLPSHFDHPMANPSTTRLAMPQIRTYIRPKRKKRFQKFLQWKEDMRRKGLQYPFHPKYKDRPVEFRTQLSRLLAKATRGTHTKWFLRDFVRQYPSFSQDKRYNHVLPYLSRSFRQRAFESFFARILREITVENNHGTNGFVWMIQFREELLDLIFLRIEELQTLDSKVKLMRQKLRRLDALKWQIHRDMANYIFTLCSQPLPQFRAPLRLHADTTMNENGMDAVTPTEEASAPPIPEADFSDEVPPEYRSGPAPPPSPPMNEIPLDSELLDSDPPRVLGCLRRLQYSDLSPRVKKRCARTEPLLAARFRGSNKRVYGWFQDETSVHPDVIVYASILKTIPRTMEQALAELDTTKVANVPSGTLDESVPDAMDHEALVENEPADGETASSTVKVVAFYGATVLHRALQNTGIAEYCVRPILRMLRQDPDTPSSVSVFSTLSPVYEFRRWLLNPDFEDDIQLLVVNEASEDFLTLARDWDCPKDQVFTRMKTLLDRSYESYRKEVDKNPVVSTAMDNLLLRCASSYIVKGKTPVVQWRCNPLELSTRYHVANGASVFRINLASDLTEAGWMESFGIRTNFIYDLGKMKPNRKKFNKDCTVIDFQDDVTRHVPRPRKLKLTKEQRERWIPIDPVRKKMIELSQNGKLFRVPLYGPPTLSRKKTHHPTLVRPRVPASSRMPPPVPTVGVSGLSISLKPPDPSGPALPSYVARTLPGGMRKVGEGLRRRNRESLNEWPDEVEFGHVEKVNRPAGKNGKKKTKSRS